jgi:hypothetical protein
MITKEEILSKISPTTIIKEFFPEPVIIGKSYKNPYRKDNNPGCHFLVNYSNELIFRDWSLNKNYDCFEIVKQHLLKNTGQDFPFYEILRYLDNHFKLNIEPTPNMNFLEEKYQHIKDLSTGNLKNLINYPMTISEELLNKRKEYDRTFKFRPLNQQDISYFEEYGINLVVLEKRVKPIYLESIDNVIIYNKQGALLNKYYYQDGDHWQTYLPNASDKQQRFKTNVKNHHLFGLSFLPEFGDLVIITSSYKDVMLYETLGIPAVCRIGESNIINEDDLYDLLLRFKRIILNYNNDITGITNANILKEKYPFLELYFTPVEEVLEKDPTDYVRRYGIKSFVKDLEKNNISVNMNKQLTLFNNDNY